VIFPDFLCKWHRQSKEEAGSAGEQPASNMVDAYTVMGSLARLPFTLPVCSMALKKLISYLINTHTIL
jgi:hypothetical protein